MNSSIVKNNLEKTLKLILVYVGCTNYRPLYAIMKKHPNFPSLLSFKYILAKVGVESMAMSSTIKQLRDELPKPVLVHVTTNVELFLLVTGVDSKDVNVLDADGKSEDMPIATFEQIWDGVALIFDSSDKVKFKQTFSDYVVSLFQYIKIPLFVANILFLIGYLVVGNYSAFSVENWAFVFVYIIGLVFSLLLLVQNIDQHNTLVRRVCGGKTGGGCSSILNSKAAMFLSIIHWSDVGVLYFSTLLIFSLIFPSASLVIAFWLSFVSFPYVGYSIIYQCFVAHNWCRLCLGVQFALFLNLMVGLWVLLVHGLPIFSISSITPFLLVALSVSMLYAIIKPLLLRNHEYKIQRFKCLQLKHTNGVLELLLSGVSKVTSPSSDSAIVLGNVDAANSITMVISPICEPCQQELRVLIPILKNKREVRIEIVFMVDPSANAPDNVLAKKLLAKYVTSGETFLDELLRYAQYFPSSREELLHDNLLNNSQNLMNGMVEWCKKNRLWTTPAIFINHRLLPKYYSTDEIDFLCD